MTIAPLTITPISIMIPTNDTTFRLVPVITKARKPPVKLNGMDIITIKGLTRDSNWHAITPYSSRNAAIKDITSPFIASVK